ncbi:hypothetical protein AGMMS50239_39320 [Bacteroidia bacterium]|nr:hypothetical protein AGMMS50239_39320 [Bacteroidia bacterium]
MNVAIDFYMSLCVIKNFRIFVEKIKNCIIMATISVDILNPKALNLLEELAGLQLIAIRKNSKRKSKTSKVERKTYLAMDFVNEFSGIIKGMEQVTDEELDNMKYEHLMKKHA